MIALPTVADIGEFGLIARLQQFIPPVESDGLIAGIGDDAAVVRLDEHRAMLITCDIQIEDQHFRTDYISYYQLGRRAMAVNLSDIAAMGGKPLFALISLAFPSSLPLDHFDELYRGMRDQLTEFSATIIGGNIAKADHGLIIDITLIGEVEMGQLLLRTGARPGDRILITGQLGGAAAGLAILTNFGRAYPDQFAPLVEKHRQPCPRIAAGQLLAQSGFATAMIDISDGLASDLYHILSASRVGAEIDQQRIPLPQQIHLACEAVHRPVWDVVLHGGEDYELLVTMKSETPDHIIERIMRESGTPITEIGRILEPEAGYSLIDVDQKRIPIRPQGWDHFRISTAGSD